ncbi:MAG: BolA/IbaG family iron-sulfur metabolism protein, partial [Gemmatimonadaceae bacterium]|nr:BolA/IbaG family iron-sulfur metabolism protein [Gloeobacterales cyanobacterium ES-bin-141]
MNTAVRIETILRERLEASVVDIEDESHLHAGHVGAAGGGGHFNVVVVSPQ